MRISIDRRIAEILRMRHTEGRDAYEGWSIVSENKRRISIFILVIQFYKYVGSNLDSHT